MMFQFLRYCIHTFFYNLIVILYTYTGRFVKRYLKVQYLLNLLELHEHKPSFNSIFIFNSPTACTPASHHIIICSDRWEFFLYINHLLTYKRISNLNAFKHTVHISTLLIYNLKNCENIKLFM